MVRFPDGRVLILLMGMALLAVQEAPASDEKALVSLGRLGERLKDVKTMSARFTQSRTTALLDEPIRSAGLLHYARDPEALAFVVEQPRRAHITFDRASYRVFRPEEKQLERFEFEDPEMGRGLFMAFNPDVAKIRTVCTVRHGEAGKGEIRVVLTPVDRRLRGFLSRLELTLAESDALLKAFAYTDADGDEVRFELADVQVNAKLAAETFDPKLPDGVKVMTHRIKAAK